MGLLFRVIELLVLIVPLIGVLYAGIRAFSAFTKRLAEAPGRPTPDGLAEPSGATIANDAAQWRAIKRAVEAHERTDARWLEYELDPAKLLDFPVMTDMREPLTTGFHRAKLRADFHKPLRAEDLLDDPRAARQYLDAVESYVTAFNAAEAEAMRRRRSDFSREDRQRIARAQNLLRVASDTAATPQERERAYGLARSELDGLIVLPGTTRASIERGIAGEIEAS
ncbi:hypothetical protein H7H78_16785 [Mycobacterium shinjukuense]|uniref:Uncharacterized protein n=1 Tax=Mycobacterium shinjukuense TaxID=398694 RepID=A0A7I7MPT7_9MYCO|nr:hypothetical protein [Mycobacterium shinjukuense]MCV6987009.1 hypothetical protein [Mycobacterium shinjukuense]ORB71101.1 hypothetical protein BST45_03700 [Mycobacterium shinjukuense]BBX73543.1 hypothetical protein MSHI_14490 [Mycobacterium shinjukuense]